MANPVQADIAAESRHRTTVFWTPAVSQARDLPRFYRRTIGPLLSSSHLNPGKSSDALGVHFLENALIKISVKNVSHAEFVFDIVSKFAFFDPDDDPTSPSGATVVADFFRDIEAIAISYDLDLSALLDVELIDDGRIANSFASNHDAIDTDILVGTIGNGMAPFAAYSAAYDDSIAFSPGSVDESDADFPAYGGGNVIVSSGNAADGVSIGAAPRPLISWVRLAADSLIATSPGAVLAIGPTITISTGDGIDLDRFMLADMLRGRDGPLLGLSNGFGASPATAAGAWTTALASPFAAQIATLGKTGTAEPSHGPCACDKILLQENNSLALRVRRHGLDRIFGGSIFVIDKKRVAAIFSRQIQAFGTDFVRPIARMLGLVFIQIFVGASPAPRFLPERC